MKKYILNKGYVYDDDDQQIIIFDGEESCLYSLNFTASLILKKIKEGYTANKIAKHLSMVFEVSEKQATKDVEAFLEILAKHKIILRK